MNWWSGSKLIKEKPAFKLGRKVRRGEKNTEKIFWKRKRNLVFLSFSVLSCALRISSIFFSFFKFRNWFSLPFYDVLTSQVNIFGFVPSSSKAWYFLKTDPSVLFRKMILEKTNCLMSRFVLLHSSLSFYLWHTCHPITPPHTGPS